MATFARNPNKLDIQHPNLKLVQGDVLDLASVQQAVQNQDAVLCSLGSGQQRTGTVRSEGTRTIIRAMEQAGVRRLICQTTLGVGESRGNLNFFWKYLMVGLLLRQVYADHGKQEELVEHSDLDWIIIRPGAFVDGERTQQYHHGFTSSDHTSKLKIARADVADFMLKQVTDDVYLHQTPALSY